MLSIAVCYLGVKFGVDPFTLSTFNKHALMLWLLDGFLLVVINSSFGDCH